MNFKKTILFISIVFLLNACQALRDGLEGNKKSKSAEEFLIKKKNPLVLPPDFTKLPKPINSDEVKKENNEFNLQKLLQKNSKQEKKTTYKPSGNLESSIIKKINNN